MIEVCEIVLDHGMCAGAAVVGVVGFGFPGEHRFLETERAYAAMLADVGAVGVARFLPG